MRVFLMVIIFSIVAIASKEYIKGEMVKRNYNPHTKLWEYKVIATDTANGKLSKANFSSKDRIMYLGDIVYCIIENGKLKEIYSMGKAVKKIKKKIMPKRVQKIKYKKVIKKQKSTKKNIKNRGWKKQVIDLPKDEIILLD